MTVLTGYVWTVGHNGRKNIFFKTKMDTCWSRLARLREVWENGTCKNDSPKKVVAVACKELVAYGKFCLWFFESKCFGFLLMYSATAADRLREVVTNEDSALLYDYWWVTYRRWHYSATKRTEATQKKILRQILKLGNHTSRTEQWNCAYLYSEPVQNKFKILGWVVQSRVKITQG